MTKEEIFEKFDCIAAEVMQEKDAEDIAVTFATFRKTLERLSVHCPKDASDIFECYEGTLRYYNFLTEDEAEVVVSRLINQDGSRGPRWRNANELWNMVQQNNGAIECKPHYNKLALYATMNYFASNQSANLMKWAGDSRDRYFEMCYDFAVTQLKDKDDLNWARRTFSLSK